MMKFLLGLIVGVVIVPAVAVLYAISGRAPVGTSEAALPFEERIAKSAINSKIEREMPTTVPLQTNEDVSLAGARVYVKDCAVCHGLPDPPAPAVVNSMFPRVPQLFRAGRNNASHPPGELFWIVKNGIRLSGMLSFTRSLSDDQIWRVTLLLVHNLPDLSPRVREALAHPSAPSD